MFLLYPHKRKVVGQSTETRETFASSLLFRVGPARLNTKPTKKSNSKNTISKVPVGANYLNLVGFVFNHV